MMIIISSIKSLTNKLVSLSLTYWKPTPTDNNSKVKISLLQAREAHRVARG
jgi:hypothetical protein